MKCPICNITREKYSVVVEDKHSLVKCFDCNHIWQGDQKIEVNYDSNYILNYFKHNTMRQLSLLRAGLVEGFLGQSVGKVLDFGYGSGDFLRVMSKNGWQTFGIDVHGLNLGIKDVVEEELYDISWDIVTFFDSLEHLQNFNILKEIHSENIIVSIPIFYGKNISTIVDWKHYKPGEHLHYFSLKSIEKLFKRYDYQLSDFNFSEDLVRGKINGKPNITTLFFEAS